MNDAAEQIQRIEAALGTARGSDANTFRLADKFAKRKAAEREAVASASSELRGTDRRVVGGEVRYYDTTDQYAIVSRQGRVIWFAVTPQGDFRI